ncbi:hypothetical protein LHJ74_05480 [Streptomyces sp. N2-109]|uniref:Uncharacterized protein n=1 Tax=Streptomyces gossypii TaxID=2883101 RepID=A0ABT2JND0_9ACTN|nr:hypothetical protein [Streptomyces gossypii]MCT2589387.1 hypothetical protein [Streptomyces gossypii]
MSDFAEEARSRVMRLLRMANTTNERIRTQIREYADATPEPPLMGSLGIGTTGCSRCKRTMWQQRDSEGPLWVCAFCGHVEGVSVACPHCAAEMEPPHPADGDHWLCPTCPRAATAGDFRGKAEHRACTDPPAG